MPFPFADGTGSPVLDELVGGPAAALTVVALVVAPGARASGWGARAATALAGNWRGPRRVILADLDLERPVLHAAAGVDNDEGVIDLIDYGISIDRLIRPAASGAYDVLPAGIFTPEPGDILRHAGWGRVLMDIAARRETLLTWVPSDADGMDAVVERAGAVLVLAEPDEGRAVVELLSHPYAVLAILTPAPAPAPAPEPAAPSGAALEEASAGAEPIAVAAAADDLVSEVLPDAAAAADDLVSEPADAAAAGDELAAAGPADVADKGEEEARAVDVSADQPTTPLVGPPVVDAALDEVVAAPEILTADGSDASAAVDEPDTAATEAGALAAAPEEPDARGEDRLERMSADFTSVAAADPAEAAAAEAAADEAEEALLREDAGARDELAREIDERQRAARLAGAANAPPLSASAAAAAAAATAAAETEAAHAQAAHAEAAVAEAAALAAHAGFAPEVTSRTAGPADAADTVAAAAPEGTAAASEVAAAEPEGAAAAPEGTPADAMRPPIGGPIASAPPAKKKRGVPRFRRPIAWTVGVVLLASLLAGAWHYLSGRLERTPAAVEAPQPEPQPPAAPMEQNALPFVVVLEAHRELVTALNRVTDLTEIEPELLFHVEPLERDATMFYHVMAGPVRDSAAALALRDRLIERGHKTGPTPTDVRATPLAFLIGDYATRAAAEEQREVLRRLDIPGYVLVSEAVDGAPVYRLYVGGFERAAQAGVIRQLLQSAGIRDSLVTRTGGVTAAESLGTEGDSVTAGDSPATRTGSSNP